MPQKIDISSARQHILNLWQSNAGVQRDLKAKELQKQGINVASLITNWACEHSPVCYSKGDANLPNAARCASKKD